MRLPLNNIGAISCTLVPLEKGATWACTVLYYCRFFSHKITMQAHRSIDSMLRLVPLLHVDYVDSPLHRLDIAPSIACYLHQLNFTNCHIRSILVDFYFVFQYAPITHHSLANLPDKITHERLKYANRSSSSTMMTLASRSKSFKVKLYER
ncbi:hypothetical protein ACLOJK_016619 [Asimina triloba]